MIYTDWIKGMESGILYKRITTYMGKNGGYKMVGFHTERYDYNKVLKIEPIHSKGGIGQCFITIPYEDLDSVINELKRIKDDIER